MTQPNRFSQQTALFGNNISYILSLYKQYCDNPNFVSVEWQDFFKDFPAEDFLDEQPIWPKKSLKKKIKLTETPSNIEDSLQSWQLIQAYRTSGHFSANLDPLNLEKPKQHPELDPKFYGFRNEDLSKIIYAEDFGYIVLKDLLQTLHNTYCGKIGVEFMHIEDTEQRNWIKERFENPEMHYAASQYPIQRQKDILRWLQHAESFEKFLHIKFPGVKRFGIDGNESLLPALETILEKMSHNQICELVIGMSHRGRLAVMTQFLKKPMRYIFAQFHGMSIYTGNEGSGDVKYHQGYSADRIINAKKIHLSLLSNPSHLEAIYPVVLGKVRGKKALHKKQILGVVLHGDAAFSGQGIVAESLQLSNLPGYKTDGTVHIIVNNQIGFTAFPNETRSSYYSSDTAKIIQAPILHVNSDDPEAVVWATELATEFCIKFKKDVVIDLIGYRRYGHNEGDEPGFTQPMMYKKIANHPTTSTLYANELLAKNLLTSEEAEKIKSRIENDLHKEFEAASQIADDNQQKLEPDWLKGDWAGIKSHFEGVPEGFFQTGIELEFLKKIGTSLSSIPSGFNLHPKIERQLKQRQQIFDSIEGADGMDWTTAEALSFASLLTEGYPVRLSGQDSARGTFSQRHGTLIDQVNGSSYTPLNNLSPEQAKIEIYNSSLSEAAVLGFEYGYSISNPNTLVLWEAQFGDFANGAQIIIDQFISSAQAKWLRLSGLVLLLPHGLEGQGPEHSSARLERYLQLSAENNWQVVNCTTPSNYFHVLRRQLKTPNRLPLVIMTPKSLLRHKLAVSPLEDLATGTYFKKILPDTQIVSDSTRRVVLCSGKVYYDLLQRREEMKDKGTALIRIEQLYPFPTEELIKALEPYKNADIVWCQEEPKNMGAWSFIRSHLERVLNYASPKKHSIPFYVGRLAASSPATGFAQKHQSEQLSLVNAALFDKLE
ncbi:MAG: 2-oxoglutarate dehydrogenase E1 component [Alphaproteobacteria bacterium]|nr:2-oxoglutarate dehydrogenase E1 component [Alphaproteobacteria bacterium]